MADDDLARLHLDKTQLGRRGARKSRVILVLLLVAAMLGGGWLYRTGALTPAIPIRLVNAATLYPAQTLALLNASGYVVAQRKAALGSKITSRLVYLGVAEGQRVKEGQVVARLENEDMLAARNRAQANIAVARANGSTAEARASVYVYRTAILGATKVPTGINDNPLASILIAVGIGLAVTVAWLGRKKIANLASRILR